MEMIVLGICALFAAIAFYLVTDYGMWEAQGVKTLGRIDALEKGKIYNVPIVAFQKADGTELVMKVERIDQLIYIISRARKDDYLNIIYREVGDKIYVRVHGYLPMVGAVLLALPLIGVLGLYAGKMVIAAQVTYVGMLAIILIAGLALLKAIYRS